MPDKSGSIWNEYIARRFADEEFFHLTMEWDNVQKTSRTHCVTGARESLVEIYFGVDADGEIDLPPPFPHKREIPTPL